jgi:hypothetical protein
LCGGFLDKPFFGQDIPGSGKSGLPQETLKPVGLSVRNAVRGNPRLPNSAGRRRRGSG